jgi:hypothetical protein
MHNFKGKGSDKYTGSDTNPPISSEADSLGVPALGNRRRIEKYDR